MYESITPGYFKDQSQNGYHFQGLLVKSVTIKMYIIHCYYNFVCKKLDIVNNLSSNCYLII